MDRRGEIVWKFCRNLSLFLIVLSVLVMVVLFAWNQFEGRAYNMEISHEEAFIYLTIFGATCLLLMFFYMRIIDPKNDQDFLFQIRNEFRARIIVSCLIQLYIEKGWDMSIFNQRPEKRKEINK
ncbi:MAG: hypothetical protein ABIA63_02100 [bacterium]